MALEIEKKFLLKDPLNLDFLKPFKPQKIEQGFLFNTPQKTLRIRLKNEKAYLTIKGPSDPSHTTRIEFETEISLEDYHQLKNLLEPGFISKDRYEIPFKGHTFEVDVFHNENKGLIIAEIELSHLDEPFDKPKWLGQEVTTESRYLNAALCKKPYTTW